MSTWRLQFPSKKEAVLSMARKSRILLEQPLFSDIMSLLPPEENLGKSREGYVFKRRGCGWKIPEPQHLHCRFWRRMLVQYASRTLCHPQPRGLRDSCLRTAEQTPGQMGLNSAFGK